MNCGYNENCEECGECDGKPVERIRQLTDAVIEQKFADFGMADKKDVRVSEKDLQVFAVLFFGIAHRACVAKKSPKVCPRAGNDCSSEQCSAQTAKLMADSYQHVLHMAKMGENVYSESMGAWDEHIRDAIQSFLKSTNSKKNDIAKRYRLIKQSFEKGGLTEMDMEKAMISLKIALSMGKIVNALAQRVARRS